MPDDIERTYMGGRPSSAAAFSARGDTSAREDTRPPVAARGDTSAREDTRPPVRAHPSRNSVHEQGFRSTVLFVTVCSEGRNPVLANEQMQGRLLAAWSKAQNWLVGRYVIMPDHIHFFCAPGVHPMSDFHAWMRYWKRLMQIAAREAARGDTSARGDTRPPVAKIWQDGCWDTQMRTGDQYEEKWNYVRNNPVRKGLCANADDWPFQGVMNELAWHD